MAIQILPQQQGLGSILGQSVASGLGNTLQGLAQLKLQDLANRQQQVSRDAAIQRSAQGYLALGYTPQEAYGLAQQPESVQGRYISNYGPLEQLAQLTGQPQVEQRGMETLQNMVQQPMQAEQPNVLAQLKQLLGGATPGQFQQFMQGQAPMQQASSPEAVTPEGVGAAPITQPAAPRRRLTRQQEKEAKLEDYRLKKLGLEERKASAAEESRANKETQKYYEKTLEEGKAAKETQMILNKMEKLIDKGKLPPAGLYKLVKDIQEKVPSTHGAVAGGALGTLIGGPAGAAIGGGLGSLVAPIASIVESAINYTYPDAEEFTKLSNSFIRGAKSIFGNRITDQDLKAFLATVPTLMQTENGKRQIIKNMRITNEATEVRDKALKQILKETGGKRPNNLPILVEERANEELDKLAKEFTA